MEARYIERVTEVASAGIQPASVNGRKEIESGRDSSPGAGVITSHAVRTAGVPALGARGYTQMGGD